MTVNPYEAPSEQREVIASSPGRVSLVEIFSKAIALGSASPWLTGLLVTINFVAAEVQRQAGEEELQAIFLTLLVSWLISPIPLAAIRGVDEGEGVAAGISRRLRWAPATLAATIALMVLVMLSAFLLFLPAIWLLVRYQFIAYPAIDGVSVPGAFAESARLVKGRWWATWMRNVAIAFPVFMLPAIVGAVDGVVGTELARHPGFSLMNSGLGTLFALATYAHYVALRDSASEPS
ncbi:MAG: hypothetical protein AAFU79_17455 [Myxococcota bacterium]